MVVSNILFLGVTMRKMLISFLCLCLMGVAPAAHAGLFKKLLVVGTVVVAAKAIAKNKKEKNTGAEQDKEQRARKANQKQERNTRP